MSFEWWIDRMNFELLLQSFKEEVKSFWYWVRPTILLNLLIHRFHYIYKCVYHVLSYMRTYIYTCICAFIHTNIVSQYMNITNDQHSHPSRLLPYLSLYCADGSAGVVWRAARQPDDRRHRPNRSEQHRVAGALHQLRQLRGRRRGRAQLRVYVHARTHAHTHTLHDTEGKLNSECMYTHAHTRIHDAEGKLNSECTHTHARTYARTHDTEGELNSECTHTHARTHIRTHDTEGELNSVYINARTHIHTLIRYTRTHTYMHADTTRGRAQLNEHEHTHARTHTHTQGRGRAQWRVYRPLHPRPNNTPTSSGVRLHTRTHYDDMFVNNYMI